MLKKRLKCGARFVLPQGPAPCCESLWKPNPAEILVQTPGSQHIGYTKQRNGRNTGNQYSSYSSWGCHTQPVVVAAVLPTRQLTTNPRNRRNWCFFCFSTPVYVNHSALHSACAKQAQAPLKAKPKTANVHVLGGYCVCTEGLYWVGTVSVLSGYCVSTEGLY